MVNRSFGVISVLCDKAEIILRQTTHLRKSVCNQPKADRSRFISGQFEITNRHVVVHGRTVLTVSLRVFEVPKRSLIIAFLEGDSAVVPVSRVGKTLLH